MKKLHYSLLINLTIIILLLVNTSPNAKIISDKEFKQRRLRIIENLDSNSVIVMKAADFKLRSNDVEYLYRQESNFFYLSGITRPDHYIIISLKGIIINSQNASVVIFKPGQNKDSLYKNNQINEVIVDNIKFNEILNTIISKTKTLYVNSPNYSFVIDWLNNDGVFLERNSRKTLKSKYPGIQIINADRIILPFREIKTGYEIEQIQKAIDITEEGLLNAIKICKPDRWEYELRAEIEYKMISKGALYTAFPSIIGSGENSLEVHYSDNNKQMKKGDLVVMDVGAEYNGYAADITRTIPVSGKFTDAQKEVYNAVLEAQKEVIKMIKPGIAFNDLSKKADEIISGKGYREYIEHSVSHHLGIDVHDPSFSDTLKAGMVLTVEPGIYIPADAQDLDEEYRGFGIRIEDDVLVTENGCRVLSDGVPKEVEEIEELMKGID